MVDHCSNLDATFSITSRLWATRSKADADLIDASAEVVFCVTKLFSLGSFGEKKNPYVFTSLSEEKR